MPIYLDNSATTRVCPQAVEAMTRCMREAFYNPSALYAPALAAQKSMRDCRDEILRAVRKIAEEARDGTLDPENLREESVSERLYTGGMPDPDLIIRPSGEERTSNFLVWEGAYSELWFSDVLWPDFGMKELTDALIAYTKRDRRFGGLTQEKKEEK